MDVESQKCRKLFASPTGGCTLAVHVAATSRIARMSGSATMWHAGDGAGSCPGQRRRRPLSIRAHPVETTMGGHGVANGRRSFVTSAFPTNWHWPRLLGGGGALTAAAASTPPGPPRPPAGPPPHATTTRNCQANGCPAALLRQPAGVASRLVHDRPAGAGTPPPTDRAFANHVGVHSPCRTPRRS